jgi:hypothetical protein
MSTLSQPNSSACQAFLDEARQQASQTLYGALDKLLEKLVEKQGAKQATHAVLLRPDEPKQSAERHRASGQKPTLLGKLRQGPSAGDHRTCGGLAEFIQDLEAASVQLSHDKAIEPLAFAALLKRFEDQQAAHDEAVANAKKLADIVITAAFVSGPWKRRLKQ